MPSETRERPLRRCTVVGDGGTSTTRQSVFCPKLERSLLASECLRCGHGSFIRRDEACDRDVIDCAWRAGDAAIRVTVGEHMSAGAVTILETLPLPRLRVIMRAEGIAAVPVVDSLGRPLGLVSHEELGLRVAGTAADVMTHDVLTLSERASLFEAAALMAYEGVSRLVVLDDERRVVGLLSALDVAAWVAREHGYVIPPAPWSTTVHRGVSRDEGGF